MEEDSTALRSLYRESTRVAAIPRAVLELVLEELLCVLVVDELSLLGVRELVLDNVDDVERLETDDGLKLVVLKLHPGVLELR